MKIKGIAWIGLVSDNPDMRRFYSDVLGIRLSEETQDMDYYQLNGDTHLEIVASDTATAASQRADAPAIAFLVEDLESAVKELKAAGAAKLTEIREWSSEEETHRWAYFEDPGGNTLLLMERS